MTAAEIIGEIRRLPAEEQGEVLEFTRSLEAERMLSGRELSGLAEQLLAAEDSAERKRLRDELERGFYGAPRVA